MQLVHLFTSLWGILLHFCLLNTTLIHAHPHNVLHSQYQSPSAVTRINGGDEPLQRRANPDLRVMALGASMVFCVGSSDGNGSELPPEYAIPASPFAPGSFRKLLRDQLRYSGYNVDMIGTKNGGTMKDNDVEATSGYVVSQIHDASKLSYKYKPNLVFINASTNDLVQQPTRETQIWGWTQDSKGSWTYIDQFFGTKGHDRANMCFPDVDGDGLDDAIWVEKFSGDAFVYYNKGRKDNPGSRYHWEIQERGGPFPAYGGSYAGSCQYFPDLNGDGRPDLHSIQATFPNTAVTAYNICDGNRSGDDSSEIKKPDLIIPLNNPGGGGSEESNSPPIPAENCKLVPDFMYTPLKRVGRSASGEDSCFAKWNKGVFIKEIEAVASSGSLRYIRVAYTDGTIEEAGVKVPDDTHHRFGTVKWDPWSDYFNVFEMHDGGFKGGVGRIVLEMSNKCGGDGNCKLDAGNYMDFPPVMQRIPRGDSDQGMLLGIRLNAGDVIENMIPMFSKARPLKVTLGEPNFTPTFEELNSKPFEERQMEIVRTSHVVYNRRADKPVEMGIDLYLQIEKGTKVNWNTQSGWESGGEIGGTIGGGMEWDIGLPEMIWAKVNGKIDVSGKWVGKNANMNFNGGEDSEIVRTMSRVTINTVVDPGKAALCQVVAIQSKANIRYHAMLTQHFANGDAYSYPVQGVFRDSRVTEAISECMDVNEDNKDEAAAAVVIEQSGTCCNDGTRVGDTGMSDEELREACDL